MTVPNLEARVKRLLTNRLGMAADEITLDARLADDLGMDSLDAMELAIATEREFGVAVSDEDMGRLETVRDILRLVERLADSPSGARDDAPRG